MAQKSKSDYESDVKPKYEGDIFGMMRCLNNPFLGIIIIACDFYFLVITKGYDDPFYWALFFLSLIGLALILMHNRFSAIEKRIESHKKLNIVVNIVGIIGLFAMVYLLIMFGFMAFADLLNLFCKYVLNLIKPCEFLIS